MTLSFWPYNLTAITDMSGLLPFRPLHGEADRSNGIGQPGFLARKAVEVGGKGGVKF